MKPDDYPMLIVWSEEDQSYLVRVLQLPGCMADGPTPEAALENARVVIAEWIQIARKLKRDVPNPLEEKALEKSYAEFQEEQRRQFEKAVSATAREIVDKMLPQIVSRLKSEIRLSTSEFGNFVVGSHSIVRRAASGAGSQLVASG